MSEPPKILLVDDEEAFLEIASVSIRKEGFETVLALGAEEGLAKAGEIIPDFIVSDIFMPPGPNGWEFALALRRNEKTKDIKIAFFTSLRDPWQELPQEAREVIKKELAEIPVFSKIDDAERLGAAIVSLIKK